MLSIRAAGPAPGVFADQVLALELNVDIEGLGRLVLSGTGTSLDGQTVAGVLAATPVESEDTPYEALMCRWRPRDQSVGVPTFLIDSHLANTIEYYSRSKILVNLPLVLKWSLYLAGWQVP